MITPIHFTLHINICTCSHRYDQSTYWGRVQHFFDMVDPSLLLVSDEKLKKSLQLLEDFKNNKLVVGSTPTTPTTPTLTTTLTPTLTPTTTVTDKDLWEARRIKEAIIHPDTHEKIPALFRMSAFVPANIPIIAGMLMSPPTILNTAFWQWINQSYNAGFNFSNRSASSPQSTSEIGTAYLSASSISVGTAVGLNELVKRSTSLSPGARGVVKAVVPFVAVASAGVANMLLMRRKEAIDGIDVRDEHGNLVGRSPAAGKICLSQVALTRVILPVPILILPPLVMHFVGKRPLLASNPRLKMLTELLVISGAIWGALPFAIATFPQTMSVETSKLEPRFHEMRTPKGEPIKVLYYNKGV